MLLPTGHLSHQSNVCQLSFSSHPHPSCTPYTLVFLTGICVSPVLHTVNNTWTVEYSLFFLGVIVTTKRYLWLWILDTQSEGCSETIITSKRESTTQIAFLPLSIDSRCRIIIMMMSLCFHWKWANIDTLRMMPMHRPSMIRTRP